MKAHELANYLLKCPDEEVIVTVGENGKIIEKIIIGQPLTPPSGGVIILAVTGKIKTYGEVSE